MLMTKEKAKEIINTLGNKKEKTNEEIRLLQMAVSFMAGNGLKPPSN